MSDTRAPFDVIVAGSGIAGLRAAIEIARGGGRVAILTKDGPTDSATDKAQGGLAAARILVGIRAGRNRRRAQRRR